MQQSVSVLKFGGTSVGSGERIVQVARIVADTLQEEFTAFPVVVVSAMSGITDQLLRIARYTCLGEHTEVEREWQLLRRKHIDAAEMIIARSEPRTTLLRELEVSFTALSRDITTLSRTTEQGQDVALPTAAVAAWGERLSILLVAAAVREQGIAAEAVRAELIITSHPLTDPSQPFGIVVGAEPMIEQTREAAKQLVAPLIERQVVPIVPGFIGRTVTGFVTTLGRNGSDYSATVIGAALDCAEVSIYTDVDGVLTADPRLVSNAQLLTHLSYAEAARLSWFGAKVLHPRALLPVASRNIPVRVCNTFRPHVRGTVVGPESHIHSGATAITIRRNLALITIESVDMFGAPESAGQVFARAMEAGATPVAICSSSGHHFSFLVEESAAASVIAFLEHDLDNWKVSCRHGLAACACIGSGFTADPMSSARAIMALARERIPLITQGASEQGITLIVEEEDSERALCCLHRDLVALVVSPVMVAEKEALHLINV